MSSSDFIAAAEFGQSARINLRRECNRTASVMCLAPATFENASMTRRRTARPLLPLITRLAQNYDISVGQPRIVV